MTQKIWKNADKKEITNTTKEHEKCMKMVKKTLPKNDDTKRQKKR